MRLAALAGLLGLSVAGHYLWLAAGRRSTWPQLFLGACARIAGVRARITGEPAARPLLLLSNHVSWLDILALGGATGTAFVAHAGLTAQPLLRWLCGLNATLFVTRSDRSGVAGEARQLRQALAERGLLTLFPEGTTGDGRSVQPFKSALLAAIGDEPDATWVQPVALRYGPDTEAVAWIGDETGIANFLRILARARPIELTIAFLPPLSGAERTSRKSMAAAAHQRIAASVRAGADP